MDVYINVYVIFFFFFKQKTAYEMRISDWSSDVCSSDLGALVGVIVEDDEVADAFVIEANPAVIGVDIGGVEIAVREMCQQPGDAVLDQVDAGRFDRFEEARGESQRDDIAAPRSEEHTSELQSLLRISYDVFFLKTK